MCDAWKYFEAGLEDAVKKRNSLRANLVPTRKKLYATLAVSQESRHILHTPIPTS
jgi:hypothetical protein